MTAALSPAKAKAREILAELKIESAEVLRCLKEICVERGAFVKEEDLDGAEARLVVSGDRGIITVPRDEAYPTRTRFSIAHELGHFELHRNAEALWACESPDMQHVTYPGAAQKGAARPRDHERREHEANEFAAELLLPEKLLRPDIALNDPSLQAIKEIAKRYQTSLSATASRYAELTDQPCAVVFSRNGVITHSIKSPRFEKQRYWIPQGPLSAYSHAHAALAGKTVPPGMIDVDATAWFQVPPYLLGQKILEQSEYFKGIGLGVTLLWIQPGRLLRHG